MTRNRGHTEGRLEDAFALFRLERVGNRVAPATLRHYGSPLGDADPFGANSATRGEFAWRL
jgi:hypothetical protein